MNTQRFDILGCALAGYRSVFAERRYLMSAALMPVGLTAFIEILKIYGIQKPSITSEMLTMLPVGVAAAWFMFLQTRLMVFNERGENIAPENMLSRRSAFEASALLWLLLQMAGLGLLAFMMYWKNEMQSESPATFVNLSFYLVIGASFWGLRLLVVHILGAIGYSIRDYIFKVNGIMVSVRMFALLMIVLLPVAIAAGPVEEALVTAMKAGNTPPLQIAGLTVLRVVLNFMLLAFFNASAVFALRQMLGQGKPQRGVTA
ncbi:MAG: hypothetical protein ACK4PK_09375 [Alphaproteobacteria bacterium]|jgi:hypothetical protein